MMWWYPGEHMSGWGWAAMSISMVLFWAVLILGGVLLFRALNRPSGDQQTPRPTPEQVLAERFARGEIDEEEYQRRRAALNSSSSGYITRT